jgi:hypothetical protein
VTQLWLIMSDRGSLRAWRGIPADRNSTFAVLDEDVVVDVLGAAKAARTLGLLASCSSSLCSLARSKVPIQLFVRDEQQADWVITSHARGRPPFSSCTELRLSVNNLAMCSMSVGVLSAMQQWTGLHRLDLTINSALQQQADASTLEYCASSMLSAVPSLRQLRHLKLIAPALGACCAAHIQQLTQLTWLRISATEEPPPAAAAADLAALSRLTNLVELHLDWALVPHMPASPEGPFCLPSSIVTLELSSHRHTSPAGIACWLAHLPGCVQLQHLELLLSCPQHHSTHPRSLVSMLLQHGRQLRTLKIQNWSDSLDFTAHVPGLPDAADPADWLWRPDADLAAMSQLDTLYADHSRLQGFRLRVEDDSHWQHLAQLSRLQRLCGVECLYAPPQPAGVTLSVLELSQCGVHLGGYDVGRLLLACPLLQCAYVSVMSQAAPASGPRLPSHPRLEELGLYSCDEWGDAAAAVAQFGALAPVLSGVGTLELYDWPLPSSRWSAALPDLSPCTAVTKLRFERGGGPDAAPEPEEEDYLSMLAPLVRLRSLYIERALRLNARAVVPLQYMLPQLQSVELQDCGRLLQVAQGGEQQEEQQQEQRMAEEEATEKVKQLLGPGLQLYAWHS